MTEHTRQNYDSIILHFNNASPNSYASCLWINFCKVSTKAEYSTQIHITIEGEILSLQLHMMTNTNTCTAKPIMLTDWVALKL